MYLRLSYDQDFDDLYMHLRSKYPKELFDMEGIGKQLDMHQFAKDFYGLQKVAADLSIDANANVSGKDVITYNFEMPKPFHKMNSYYLLWKRLKKSLGLTKANQIIEQQLVGDIYINDFWDIGRPYCFNYSTYDIALEGLPMGDRVKPVPPKSLYSFVRQVEQFTVYAANSTLGATGLADLFIVMAWYVDKMVEDTLQGEHFDHRISTNHPDSYAREVISSLIYTLNWQFRGNQSPFTNVSLYDRVFLESLVPHYIFPNGKSPKIKTVQALQRMFMDIMNSELERSPLTFPVTTACFAVDDGGEVLDKEFAREVAEQNLKFGFINIYCGKTSTLSSCCRLRSESQGEYFNAFGAGSTKIGSLGVVTLNLPRLAYKTQGWGCGDVFLHEVAELVKTVGWINNAKREIVGRRVERGNLPLYALGHMDLKRQYSTVGITGLYEALEILGYDIKTEEGQAFAIRLMDTINATNDECAKQFGAPHNVEQVPGENSSVTLARKDKFMGFDTGYPYYSNQFLPLTCKADMLERIKLQGLFDKHFSGGAICHLNVAERLEKWEDVYDLILHCAKQGVVYWAINYCLNRCENGHMTVGRGHSRCPECGYKITDSFTRVVGFLTNTKHWNKTRRQHDWPKRQFYGG